MHAIKQELAAAIADATDADVDETDIEVPKEEFGDFAFPVMRIAGQKDENPREYAEQLRDELEQTALIDSIEVAGPGYLNFFLDRAQFADRIQAMLQSDNMGVEQQSGRMLLEFSSPNVAKPMHVGHFRNNALGDSLQRILRFVGYDVTAENYIGDWGTQYGKLIYAYKEFGSPEQFEESPMEHMFDLYVRFHEEADDDEEIEEKGREWAQRIEDGDEEAQELWNMFRDASIAYHADDYERMGVQFDRWTGESTVVDRARDLLERGIEQGVFDRNDDSSVSIEFEDLPSTILKKADGTTLYLSRDLANLEKRVEECYNYNLYVVASEQNLHFQQLLAAAERLDINTDGTEHVSYGLLELPEGSMSSREGRIIRLSDVLDTAVAKAQDAVEKREHDGVDTDEIAEAVGIGAVKYANLAVSRNKTIEFDWDSVLSFEGDSGPYLQYSSTRAKSIMRKAELTPELTGELTDTEHRLLKKLGAFPETVTNAADNREPATIANYLSQLCESFNSFYHDSPVLDADDTTTRRRLAIIALFIAVTDTGMELLGMEPLEEM